jgi:hypothetical protein
VRSAAGLGEGATVWGSGAEIKRQERVNVARERWMYVRRVKFSNIFFRHFVLFRSRDRDT